MATELLLVVGLLGFVGAAFAVERLFGLNEPVKLGAPLALLLSTVPALLWLVYFYLQDRHEPEPKHYVLGVYLIGAFVAAPVAAFIIDVALPLRASTIDGSRSAERLVAAIFSVGLAQELAKFLVVRYSIYLSPEFDEPMDGIIYMTAAGIGFATTENVRYFMSLDGVFLAVGTTNAVVTTLAHACFAGVLGYALGRARFGRGSAVRRNLTLFAGLILAAALNGLFTTLEAVVKSTGMKVQPWRGLAFAAGFAAIVFFVTSLLMRRQLAASPQRA